MPGALLVQPASEGRISGGYVYNVEMARHGAWELWEGGPAELPQLVAGIRHGIVIVDSIWLTERTLPLFFALRERDVRVGALIHALPSRVAAAEAGKPAPAAPSAFEADALARLDFTLVPGPFYARLLAGIAADVHVVEPGLDGSFRSPPRPRGARCELVSIGAVTPLKGFLDVLDILERFTPAENVRWTVAGSLSADAAYASAFCERARASARIEILGQQSPSEVRALVQRSDILIMPSYEENQPLVLLEAMAASVPSVGYAAGAATEILDRGVTGLLAEIGDRGALEGHVRDLVRNEERRSAMARACWERQASIPSWADAARRAHDVITTVASKR